MATVAKTVYWALGVGAFTLFILGPALAYGGIVPGQFGFLIMGLGCMLSVLGALVGLIIVIRRGPKPLFVPAALCVVPVAVLVYGLVTTRQYPLINDISTDLADPPAFVHAKELPANEGVDMAYPSEFPATVRAAYPDLDPLALNQPADAVFNRVMDLADAQDGWEVTATRLQPDVQVIEGHATTGVFQFVDDFVIRVRKVDGENCLVDMRSRSRVGKGDLGANAERIRSFLGQLKR